MSLDIWLQGKPEKHKCYCSECGHEHDTTSKETFYESNITHNLGKMADACGVYKHLWRPEELGIKTAKELIEPLNEGLRKLKQNPEHYKQFDAPNGWGKYEHLVEFIQDYITACVNYPDSEIKVDR